VLPDRRPKPAADGSTVHLADAGSKHCADPPAIASADDKWADGHPDDGTKQQRPEHNAHIIGTGATAALLHNCWMPH